MGTQLVQKHPRMPINTDTYAFMIKLVCVYIHKYVHFVRQEHLNQDI